MRSRQHPGKDWESDILDQLDRCAGEFRFPILNSIDSHLAGARLTSFRSPQEWLIVFEQVALYEEYLFTNNVYGYGNKVRAPGVQLAADDIIKPVPGKELWGSRGNLALNLFDFEMVINGKRRRFSPGKADYRAAKISLESGVPDAAKLLRYLVATVPEEFFMSDRRLLEICGRKTSKLKLFLRLDDWNHPDVAAGELPSESISLRTLAAALAQNDPSVYSCPKNRENTHWRNWKPIR